MAWLSRLGADTDFVTGIALPMVLIGLGQGATLGPLTAAGIRGVAGPDAGADGGVTNVAHQVGGSLGLAALVAVYAAADAGGRLGGVDLLAHRISAALTAGTALLALALLMSLAARPRRQPVAARAAAAPAHRERTPVAAG